MVVGSFGAGYLVALRQPFLLAVFSRRHECFDWRAGSVYAQLYALFRAVLRAL